MRNVFGNSLQLRKYERVCKKNEQIFESVLTHPPFLTTPLPDSLHFFPNFPNPPNSRSLSQNFAPNIGFQTHSLGLLMLYLLLSYVIR